MKNKQLIRIKGFGEDLGHSEHPESVSTAHTIAIVTASSSSVTVTPLLPGLQP